MLLQERWLPGCIPQSPQTCTAKSHLWPSLLFRWVWRPWGKLLPTPKASPSLQPVAVPEPSAEILGARSPQPASLRTICLSWRIWRSVPPQAVRQALGGAVRACSCEPAVLPSQGSTEERQRPGDVCREDSRNEKISLSRTKLPQGRSFVFLSKGGELSRRHRPSGAGVVFKFGKRNIVQTAKGNKLNSSIMHLTSCLNSKLSQWGGTGIFLVQHRSNQRWEASLLRLTQLGVFQTSKDKHWTPSSPNTDKACERHLCQARLFHQSKAASSTSIAAKVKVPVGQRSGRDQRAAGDTLHQLCWKRWTVMWEISQSEG